MIHRSERLDEIFILMEKHSFKIKRLQFVFPFIEKPPVMILVEARKNANSGVKVLEPLIMYDSKGIYSKQIEAIYKNFPSFIIVTSEEFLKLSVIVGFLTSPSR